MNRLILGALALVLILAGPAQASGLWPLSYTQRHDLNGKPYPGAKAYFYDAETDDPIAVYREYSLATPLPNPVEADANGVFPGVFISGDKTFYRFRVTTAGGVVLSDDAVIPNIGPAEGEGGDPPEPVPASSIARTGDVKARLGEGILEGWLPLNGRTMGAALSGADYVGADNEELFLYLWELDDGASVVGGAGDSAAADWAANKRMTLPDARGRALVGLDTMGNSAAGVFSGLDALGEKLGGSVTLVAGNIPQITGTTSTDGAHTHTFPTVSANNVEDGGSEESARLLGGTSNTSSAGSHSHTVTAGSANPTAVSTTAPSIGMTIYIKL